MSLNSLNSLLDRAISVANVAGKKTEEMVEASKLKLQEVSLDSDLEDCYAKIGSLVYRSRKSGLDNEEEIAQLIEQADELLNQLTDLKLKRAEMKKTQKCPNCGASCDISSHFCSRCGMVLAEEEVQPEVQAAESVQMPEETAEQTTEEQKEPPIMEEKL